MQNRYDSTRTADRAGFTLIELLVVISIMAALMALILPAIQSAREAARRTQCLNRLRNLTIGLANFSTQTPAAQFPAYGTWGDHRNDSTGLWVNNSTPAQLKSWVVDVLPYIDRLDLADRWQPDRKHDSTFRNNGFSNLDLIREFNMEVLTCPDDQTAAGVNGALSYVANAGYASVKFKSSTTAGTAALAGSWGSARQQSHLELLLDWDRDGKNAGQHDDPEDIVINHRTGVMWPETLNRQGVPNKPALLRNHSQQMGSIYDGTGNTLILTENVNAGGHQYWGDPDPRYVTFVYPIDTNGSAYTAANYFYSAPLDPNLPMAVINGARSGPDGERPFPNSNHPGGVNVGFCDGSCRFLSEDIDLHIYAQLITPSGAMGHPGVTPQPVLSQSSF